MNNSCLRQYSSFLKCAVLLTVVLLTTTFYAQQAATVPAADLTDQQVEARVNALLQKMTLDEKIGQLTQISGDMKPKTPDAIEFIRKRGAGSVLWAADAETIDRLQHVAMDESRLKIPILFGLDVIHGYKTIFPAPLAMASSWDPQMIEEGQGYAAREARAAGITWSFGPMVDIARDPRWGRIVEGAGEDPFLGAAIARAQVRGLQGPRLGTPDRVVASVKHFAGYGAADGGRDYDSSYIPDSQMWNVYLPPFKAAVDAGVGTVMSAYMDLNDVPATGNRFLLQEVLRDEWKFKGFVVSDAFAVGSLVTHGYARDRRDAAFKAIDAGVNMEMASGVYPEHLASLVQEGKISMARIDELVRPILEIKIRMGLFEHPYAGLDEAGRQAVFNTPAHKQFALRAAQRSIVLLRNQNGMLPLDRTGKKVSSIAVVGPVADLPRDIMGMWGVIGHPPDAGTVLQGIRDKVGKQIRVEYAKGPNIRREFPSFFETDLRLPADPAQTPEQAKAEFDKAVETARRCDLTILVLGETALMNGEAASVLSLNLAGQQQQLMESIAALGKPVVLVLINGRPLNISWAAEHVPAIVEAWMPGSQGGNAIADVLFGDVNPGGKLPVSWPRVTGQVPVYHEHNLTQNPETAPEFKSRYWDGLSSPLYPFGYGLSYTTFSYSNLQVSNPQPKVGESFSVSVDVENTGKVAGDEVVQLYVHQRAGSASRPIRELKGFQRISLAPGEKKTVQLSLGRNELQYWSGRWKKWIEEAEEFDVWVGGDSTASLHSSFKVVE